MRNDGHHDALTAVLRRLARDQWVRLHGTPRVTVLVGDADARAVWDAWIGVTGHQGVLLDDGAIEQRIRRAVERASESPSIPIGVLAAREDLALWRHGRTDRFAAMVDEGVLEMPAEPIGITTVTTPTGRVTTTSDVATSAGHRDRPTSPAHFDARSAAEAAMYEALRATPATAGRFELNERLSVTFGSQAAEVDLLSRADRIAIEIDGVHHFENLDRYRRDRRKDLLLQTQGLLVVRVLAEDVLRDARPAVTMVCQALAYRRDEEARR